MSEPPGNAAPDDTAPDAPAGIAALLEGAAAFESEVFPRDRARLEALAGGQSPHTLFVTCADSRISPELITRTRPGEMFALRNIGNIVPRHGEGDAGAAAVVEYAVSALRVRHIVVCGHSDCGAMKALADPGAAGLDRLPDVRSWLAGARDALDPPATPSPDGGEPGTPLDRLVERNVRLQLAHLRTHPSVAAALAENRLDLHGWIYDLAHGRISVIDERSGRTLTPDEARAAIRTPGA